MLAGSSPYFCEKDVIRDCSNGGMTGVEVGPLVGEGVKSGVGVAGGTGTVGVVQAQTPRSINVITSEKILFPCMIPRFYDKTRIV